MTTGYTCGVADGTVTEFKVFALHCARAFGACVTMRDEPFDAEIPEEFSPAPFYAEYFAQAEKNLNDFSQMSEAERRALHDKEYNDVHSRWEEREKKNALRWDRYRKMLKEVKAFNPPIDEHKSFKTFMIDQLESSMRFDSISEAPPIKDNFENWQMKKQYCLRSDCLRAKEQLDEEIMRVENRNAWLKALRSAL